MLRGRAQWVWFAAYLVAMAAGVVWQKGGGVLVCLVGCSSSSGPRWRHRSGRLGRGRGQARGLRRSRWQRKSSGAGSCVSGPCECPAGCRAREFWGAAAELWLNGVLTVSVGARYGPGARCVRSLSIQYIVRGGLVGCSRVWWWFSWGGLGGLERRPARARAPLPSQPPGPPQAVAARCIVWQMVVLCRLGGAVVLGDCQGVGALGAWGAWGTAAPRGDGGAPRPL